MQNLLLLRPRTLLPITPLEEERILASLPETTLSLIEHPLLQEGEHDALEQQHNPYVHRFRRTLLLRQVRKHCKFDLKLFANLRCLF